MADTNAASGQEPNGSSDQESQSGNGQEPPTQTTTFDAEYVSGLRAEAAKYRKELKAHEDADAQRQAEAEAAEAQRLKDSEKWQELAETNESKAADAATQLETANAQVERLTAALDTYLTAEMENVPEHIAPLLDKLDVVDRLAYLTKNRDALTPKKAGGVPPSPKPGEPSGMSDEERREKAFAIRL